VDNPVKSGLPMHIDLYRPADKAKAEFATLDFGDPI
jgi:hypothetical protein